MHFGENQLSQSLIGLSPLSTAHPPSFQPRWVRSSTTSYRRFNLAMDRSLRFGSRSCHSHALFRLAFATASPHGLTSRQNTNSQAHSSKGTLSPRKAPTACKHTVSGTISDLPGGPGRFTRDSTSPVLLGWHTRGPTRYGYGALTHYGHPSQGVHLHARTSRRQSVETALCTPTTPMMQPSTGITHHRFSLFRFRSPLLTESSFYFLFLRVLRCFTSPRSPQPAYTFNWR